MPAMHVDVYEAMVKVLEQKRDLMVRLIPFEMSHDECLELVAPSDHINILKQAAKYADIKAAEEWMYITAPGTIDGETAVPVQLHMRTHAQKEPPLRPRHPEWQPSVPGEKVIAWMQKRLELGRRFGTASYVLSTLNRECDTGTQLRYMLPAVLNLCKAGMNDRMDRWAEKFSAYKSCRHTPAVSPHLKRAIQDTSALLTSCTLIGDDVPERALGEVGIEMWNMPSFEINGVQWSRK